MLKLNEILKALEINRDMSEEETEQFTGKNSAIFNDEEGPKFTDEDFTNRSETNSEDSFLSSDGTGNSEFSVEEVTVKENLNNGKYHGAGDSKTNSDELVFRTKSNVELEFSTKKPIQQRDDSVSSEARKKYSLSQRKFDSQRKTDSVRNIKPLRSTDTGSESNTNFRKLTDSQILLDSPRSNFAPGSGCSSFQSTTGSKPVRKNYSFPKTVWNQIGEDNVRLHRRIEGIKQKPVVLPKPPFMLKRNKQKRDSLPTEYATWKKELENRSILKRIANAKPSKEISGIFSTFAGNFAVNRKRMII